MLILRGSNNRAAQMLGFKHALGSPGQVNNGGNSGPTRDLVAPVLSLAGSKTVYPVSLAVVIDSSIPVGCTLNLRISDTWNFAPGTYVDVSHVITAAEASANASSLGTALSSISAPKFYKAWITNGNSYSPDSNTVAHGDAVAPTISGGGSTSSIENAPMAVTFTTNEPCYFTLGGADAGALELYGSQPATSIVVRRVGNTNLDYETARSYDFTVTATDLADNAAAPVVCTHTIINDPSDDPPYDYAAFGHYAAYDVSRPGGVFKDIAGTIPATADGDDVCYLADLSGNGRHLIAPDTAHKWTLHVSGGHKWIEPASTTASLRHNAGSIDLNPHPFWRFNALRMTGGQPSVDQAVWGPGDPAASTGYLVTDDGSYNLWIQDGYWAGGDFSSTWGTDIVLEETHVSGNSALTDGTNSPGGSWGGATAIAGLALGQNGTAYTVTAPIRFYGSVLHYTPTWDSTSQDDVRAVLHALMT